MPYDINSPEELYHRQQALSDIELWMNKVGCAKYPEKLNDLPVEERAKVAEEVERFNRLKEERRLKGALTDEAMEEIARSGREEAAKLIESAKSGLRNGTLVRRGDRVVPNY